MDTEWTVPLRCYGPFGFANINCTLGENDLTCDNSELYNCSKKYMKKYEVAGPRRAPGKAPGPGGVLNLALVLDLERRGAGRRAGGEMGAGRDRIIELN